MAPLEAVEDEEDEDWLPENHGYRLNEDGSYELNSESSEEDSEDQDEFTATTPASQRYCNTATESIQCLRRVVVTSECSDSEVDQDIITRAERRILEACRQSNT
jgi:hypothetical protein